MKNHFDLMRLLLASSVIVGHGLMIKHPNFSADPVYSLGRAIDLHSLAVDFFFIISGYLITASWISTPNAMKFGEKRVRRIYPGFIACFLFCVLIVAPLVNSTSNTPVLANLRHLLLLSAPISNAFAGTEHPALNAPMWTIQFEFACYAMVAALGLSRLLNRWMVLALLAVFIGLSFTSQSMWYAMQAVRLIPLFLAGMAVFMWKPRLTTWLGVACCLLTVLSLAAPWSIRAVLPITGALSVYFIAFLPSRILSVIRPAHDVSYGVYLYGWPMQKIVQLYFPTLGALTSILFSFALVVPLAILSWKLVEAPLMKRKPRSLPMATVAAAP